MKPTLSSPELRKKAVNVLIALIFFIISYLLLITLGLGLTAFCVYLGIYILAAMPGIITLLIAAGIISLGAVVVFFLLKFIFKKYKADSSGMLEITEADAPELFVLIRALASEVKTDMPKKVYLSPDVNASVFYDSSFWSMFFPVRKNLQIGLGLINGVTTSELKAILAHEFGHFSQDSMKIGSYVYNINRIIHNLLFDNSSFHDLAQRWASVNVVIYFSVNMGMGIVRGIQFLLIQLYSFVNVRYMGLSREMEFEADAIAAAVAGSKTLETALTRLGFMQFTFNTTVDFYNERISEGKRTTNIFSNHLAVTELLSRINKITFRAPYPLVTLADTERLQVSRVMIKDQWASHPSDKDRVERLRALALDKPGGNDPAWNFLLDAGKWQRLVTDKMFESVSYKQAPENISNEMFQILFTEQIDHFSFDPFYHNFYSGHTIGKFDLRTAIAMHTPPDPATAIKALFNEQHTGMLKHLQTLESDIAILKQIEKKEIRVSTFDFNNIRYRRKDARRLVDELEREAEVQRKAVADISMQAFACFYSFAQQQDKADYLIRNYEDYFATCDYEEKDISLFNEMVECSQFMFETNTIEHISNSFPLFTGKEKSFKERLRMLRNKPGLVNELDQESRENLDRYLATDLIYFRQNTYIDSAVELFRSAMYYFRLLSSRDQFLSLKSLLNYQLDFLKEA